MSHSIRCWRNSAGVELANPVLEIDAALPGGDEERKRAPLKILGLDIFRASVMAPDLIGIPAEDKLFDILADDAIFLSPAAMEWLEVKQGDLLQLRVGTQPITLRVAGGLARVRAGQRIARHGHWRRTMALPAFRPIVAH